MKKELSKLSKIFVTILMALTCVQNIAVYAEGSTGKATYEFVSNTTGWDIPQEVTDLKPTDNTEYDVGTTVNVIDLATENKTVRVNDGIWSFVGWDESSKTMTESGVTFTGTWSFTQKTGKAGYYLTLPNATWKIEDEQEKIPAGISKVVEEGKVKYYYDKRLSKGEKFTVVSDKPVASGYQFIGWLDKERGDQAAAIRKATETCTYIYNESENRTYTLDALWANITVTDYTGTYDGEAHSVTLNTDADGYYIAFNGGALDDKYKAQAKALITIPADRLLLYSTDNYNWSDTNPTFTEAGTYTVYLSQDVELDGHIVTLHGQGTVTINRLPVDITSGDGNKTYDGQPLTNSTLTYKDGVQFVTGDVTTVAATGTITNVGEANNTIDITYSSAEKANNYNVTKHEGKLIVNAATLDISSNLTDDAATKVYDGQPLSTTATSTTEGATIKYSLDGGTTWVDEVPSITNVGTLTVKAKASKTNYNDATVTYTLKVTKRPIEIVGESGSKTYTGSEQELTGYSVNTAEGKYDVVTGQVLSTTYSAKGTDANADGYTGTFGTIVIKSGETDVTDNYAITPTPGKLVITQQTINPGTDPEKKDPAYDGVEVGEIEDVIYNGKPQEEVPTVQDKAQNDLEKDKDYTITYSRDTTNVGKVTVTIEGTGNYTGTIERTYNIKPATLKVVTPSKSKTYDGNELTAEGTLTGLVNGETVEFKTTGSQTIVGSSKNTYSLKWATAKEDNYTIEESIGTLTVTEKSSKNSSGGWDDGGPFTTDTCGNVFDRWGNKIYEAKGCNVGGYNLVRTSVED